MTGPTKAHERGRRTILIVCFSLAMVFFLSLGTWQLWRAEQRAASFDRFAESGELPSLGAPIGDDEFEQHRYRWLELRGQYASSRQILLDSITHEGRAGYHVLTPFRAAGDASWVLVNRGWVPADPERRQLPEVDVGEAARVIRARIDALPRPGLTFEDSGEPGSGWPQVALFPTFNDLEARLGHGLRRYQLLLSPEAPDGYVRAWQPRAMTPERHIGYAIQWYSFAGVLVVIAVVLGLRSKRR